MKRIRNKFTKTERRLKFNYFDFIKSDFWIKQKQDWYSRHKKRCATCGETFGVHLHHKVYPKNKRFLSLKDNDFVCLCKNCHFEYHDLNGVKQYMQTTTNRFIKNKKTNCG